MNLSMTWDYKPYTVPTFVLENLIGTCFGSIRFDDFCLLMIPPKTFDVYATNKTIFLSGVQNWGSWPNFKIATKYLIWPVTVFLRRSRLALRKAPQLGHFLTNWPQFFCKWKLRTISSWYLVISDRLFDIGAEILALSEKNPDIKIPVFSGGKTLTAWAFGPITQKIFDPKPFSVGHIGPNLSLHTPFTPLPNTFLIHLVKRMTLKKNIPPPRAK